MIATPFTGNRFMQTLAVGDFEVNPGDHRNIIERTINDYPGIFFQNQIQCAQTWQFNSEGITQALERDVYQVIVLGTQIKLPGFKYRKIIKS